MSFPSPNFGSSKRLRARSQSSLTSPRVIPGSSASTDETSHLTADSNYGSFRGFHDNNFAALLSPATASGPREPTRSSVHLSYRGPNPTADTPQQYARSVREDTAELATYALSDNASQRSTSPTPHRPRQTQTRLENYFQGGGSETASSKTGEGLQSHTIHEVSEPVSPEVGPMLGKSPGTSIIADMLRRSPPSTSPEDVDQTPVNRGSYNGDEQSIIEHRQSSQTTDRAPSEITPLLGKDAVEEPRHRDWIRGEDDIEGQKDAHQTAKHSIRQALAYPASRARDALNIAINPKTWSGKAILQNVVLAPLATLPAVILGLLMNVLDALSYGMILFPLGQPIFQNLGPAGISMFYVSTIISQLVYSCGGSIFKGGIGSEMIEVVPFFHAMAFSIMQEVGEENPAAVIATTITTYALSSIITGLVFFLMGYFNFGYIVGFIPRHILIGCIGGVGFFLMVTGIEVTARLDGNLNYNLVTLQKLFQLDTLPLWLIPLSLAIFLFAAQHKISSKYFLPGFIVTIPLVFYFFVFSMDQLEPSGLRQSGWIFDGPEAGEPWWYFYTLYDFSIVNWQAVGTAVPAMFALTFFGVLHVPINVPALAFAAGEDDVNLDRELIAHGISNAVSGFAGSIQNYLVYTNSIVFMRSGGDSRLAGIMLAFFTFVVMLIGPVIIGYIPIMMVGILIYVLGLELLVEALWSPRRKLKWLEYGTVIAIVVIMGAYDFVVGIFVGIMLAFISLIVQSSQIAAIRASYSGEVAGSTVRRNPVQYRFLRDAGRQIHVAKLTGNLFFGTIVTVEERIRKLIEDEAFQQRPIRFLIFDLYHVTGIDYSAAEAFNRLNRVFSKKGVTLLMSGVDAQGAFGTTLLNVGLGQEGNEVKLFSDLNSALESCENELLKTFYASREARITHNAPPAHLDVPGSTPHTHTMDTYFSSPRRNQLHQAAATTLDENPHESRYLNFKEPLRLILQTFQGLTDKNEDFWFRIVPYFVKKEYLAGTILYHHGELANGFYILQEGVLRADYELPQGRYYESIVAGTTCGELPFFSDTERTATVQAERDCVAWLLHRENWEKLQKEEPDICNEMLTVSMKLTSERMSAITSYVLTTAG